MANKGSNPENVVTPVRLAKELGIRPQLVFSWIRRDPQPFPTHECVCGHTYLLRDEIADFLTARATREAEKAAKVTADLEKAEATA